VGLLFFSAIGIVFAILSIAAAAWGVDSREGSHDPRSPEPGYLEV